MATPEDMDEALSAAGDTNPDQRTVEELAAIAEKIAAAVDKPASVLNTPLFQQHNVAGGGKKPPAGPPPPETPPPPDPPRHPGASRESLSSQARKAAALRKERIAAEEAASAEASKRDPGASLGELRSQASMVERDRRKRIADEEKAAAKESRRDPGASQGELRSQAGKVASLRESRIADDDREAKSWQKFYADQDKAKLKEEARLAKETAESMKAAKQAERDADREREREARESRRELDRANREKKFLERMEQKSLVDEARAARRKMRDAEKAEAESEKSFEQRKRDLKSFALGGFAMLLGADKIATNLAKTADPFSSGATFDESKNMFKITMGNAFQWWLDSGSRTLQGASNWLKELNPNWFDPNKATDKDRTFGWTSSVPYELQNRLETYKDDPETLRKVMKEKLKGYREELKDLEGKGYTGGFFKSFFSSGEGRMRDVKDYITGLEKGLGEHDSLKGFKRAFEGPTSQVYNSTMDYSAAMQKSAMDLSSNTLMAENLAEQVANAQRANQLLTDLINTINSGVPIKMPWRGN